jgi:hypothetical protein
MYFNDAFSISMLNVDYLIKQNKYSIKRGFNVDLSFLSNGD